ncbi:MAG: AmmeMemoRadiSam system protein B [Candidatus Eisenbacteria bacterium]|nr:AmmeMemoRadiSam system protein B [Candidatus Eisenbacteria bacterium]
MGLCWHSENRAAARPRETPDGGHQARDSRLPPPLPRQSRSDRAQQHLARRRTHHPQRAPEKGVARPALHGGLPREGRRAIRTRHDRRGRRSVTHRALSCAAACLLLLVPLAGCHAEGGDAEVNGNGSEQGLVRQPVVAGAFYPGGPDELARAVDRFMESADVPAVDGDVVAIVAPHAGYVYSGGVAGHAYSLVRGHSYDTVIVVAPSHRATFRGASVFDGDAYETPLGSVPVDGEVVSELKASGLVFEPRAHAQEHSLEVQVPFLQRALGDFSLVPIVMGEQSEVAARTLAAAISDVISRHGDKRFLLVASTDLSHYHSQDAARRLDEVAVKAVDAFDPEGLLTSLASGECEACGGGPTAAVLFAARELGAENAEVLKYATSGDVSGDMSQVVGYMAAVATRPVGVDSGPDGRGSSRQDEVAGDYDEFLTEAERRELLRLARASIRSALDEAPSPSPRIESEAFNTPSGAFVTLHSSGRLRGCIGAVQAVRPLAETVISMAVEAALRDPRFPPVTMEELNQLDIEISVMSPLRAVEDVSEIKVGRDGLVIQRGGRSGLLLPQVATEYGWDRDTFLDHTCQKAGLPAGTWRDPGTTILRFSAEVFGEKELGIEPGEDRS